MKKVLYIVGTTASGKTSLALDVSSTIKSDLISADSRQIYTGMDIGTGKDIPEGYKPNKKILDSSPTAVYTNGQTNIWGYDLASPQTNFSISKFYCFACQAIKQIHKNQKLPIVVGGTGFYIDSIENPPETVTIPKNSELRIKLKGVPVKGLQNELIKLDKSRFLKMNQSDNKNPRRLIRAIEIATHKYTHTNTNKDCCQTNKYDSLWIGIKLPLDIIDKNIEKRVKNRLNAGFEKEFNNLYMQGNIDEKFQSTHSTGYRQWLEYKQGKISKNEAINKWTTAEKQYARRQITWFKKKNNINWFKPKKSNFKKSVVEFVRVWYS